ncbi:MAG: hypothetical protein ACI9MS_001042 [Glaciecola sp.]|jgi:hypothetical protein
MSTHSKQAVLPFMRVQIKVADYLHNLPLFDSYLDSLTAATIGIGSKVKFSLD